MRSHTGMWVLGWAPGLGSGCCANTQHRITEEGMSPFSLLSPLSFPPSLEPLLPFPFYTRKWDFGGLGDHRGPLDHEGGGRGGLGDIPSPVSGPACPHKAPVPKPLPSFPYLGTATEKSQISGEEKNAGKWDLGPRDTPSPVCGQPCHPLSWCHWCHWCDRHYWCHWCHSCHSCHSCHWCHFLLLSLLLVLLVILVLLVPLVSLLSLLSVLSLLSLTSLLSLLSLVSPLSPVLLV